MENDMAGKTQEELDREDEVARKRAQRGDASTGDGDGEDAQSVEQIEANDGVGEEDDGQLFVLEEGTKVTLGTLIKRGTPVEYEFKLESKGIPGAAGMGLISFSDPERILVVPGRAGKVETEPTYGPDGAVKKVTIRAHFKPSMAYDARSEAAKAVLHGEPAAA